MTNVTISTKVCYCMLRPGKVSMWCVMQVGTDVCMTKASYQPGFFCLLQFLICMTFCPFLSFGAVLLFLKPAK